MEVTNDHKLSSQSAASVVETTRLLHARGFDPALRLSFNFNKLRAILLAQAPQCNNFWEMSVYLRFALQQIHSVL